MNYKAFPRDFATASLSWDGLDHSCLQLLRYGNWFDVQLKSDQYRFSVHTGGRNGDLTDPGIYMGVVEEKSGRRSIKEVACVQHSGEEGVFHLEATSLDPTKQYFVLVSGEAEGKFYAISTTDDFNPTPKQEEEKPPKLTAVFQTIFGRVLNRQSKGVGNVKVSLLNASNEPLSTTITDEKGVFEFSELPKDETYITRIEAEDTELKVDMFLVDQDGNIKARSTKIDDQLYAFQAENDGFPQLHLLSRVDEFTIIS